MRKLLRWSIQIFLSGIFLFMFTTTISKKHILLSNDSQFNQKFQVNENQILINNKKREFGNISNIEKYSPTHVNFSQDSFIFMHIQKTSGTFWIDEIKQKLLVNIDETINKWLPVCTLNIKKVYICNTRKSYRIAEVFWHWADSFNCDIHAGYAELLSCLKRDRCPHGNNHFITMLRNPVERYISEFEHIKEGATWFKAVRQCIKEKIYSRTCYQGSKDWKNATWNDFLNCEYNLANNRQVRMLANYNEIGCDALRCMTKSAYCSSEMKNFYDELLLESAKKSLLSFAYFGLSEYQNLSFLLFRKTFENKLKFNQNFIKHKESMGKKLFDSKFHIYLNEINENNKLDVKLYEFAQNIFFDRLNYFQILHLENNSTTNSN